MNNERSLQDLLAKLIDGTLTEPEHLQLQDWLRDNPTAQQAYFDFLDLDTDLREMSHEMASSNEVARGRMTSWKSVSLWLAMAASLLLIGSYAWFNRESHMATSGGEDVVLVQSAGAQFFRDVMPAVGQALKKNHEYALTAGLIELKFTSGAEVILDAPAVIEIADADRLIVRQGSCSVHAPPGAEGFQVLTPRTEVTDLGTRFSVSVDEGGDTEVQVIEGEAEVRQRGQDSTAKVLLTKHQASRFIGGQSSPIEFAPKQYRSRLPDRVTSFRVGTVNGETNGLLESVSVQRAGVSCEYTAEQLIGVEVTYFRGGKNTNHLSVGVGEAAEEGVNRRRVIESDSLLHTGILNLGGSTQSLTRDPMLIDNDSAHTTPGMAIRFREPVINGPGPDVVFFELQSVVNPANGDGFHVSPLRFDSNLRSLTVTQYDITLNSPEARPIPDFDLLQFDAKVNSVEELLVGRFERRNPAIPFWAIAVGIDLSDLGYAADAIVEGLFFQDAMDDEQYVDPVFIGGLPQWKEEA